MRKVEFDGLADGLKKSQAKLKEVIQIGEPNDKIAARLAQLKEDVAALEAKVEPFVSSGAKLVTEAEL